jgi:hypothetical protein
MCRVEERVGFRVSASWREKEVVTTLENTTGTGAQESTRVVPELVSSIRVRAPMLMGGLAQTRAEPKRTQESGRQGLNEPRKVVKTRERGNEGRRSTLQRGQ